MRIAISLRGGLEEADGSLVPNVAKVLRQLEALGHDVVIDGTGGGLTAYRSGLHFAYGPEDIDVRIDPKAIGCPLLRKFHSEGMGGPRVDWAAVVPLLVDQGIALRPSWIIVSAERGVLVGEMLGLQFWSEMDACESPAVMTFDREMFASQHMLEFCATTTNCFVAPIVCTDDSQGASMQDCVDIGIPAWKVAP